VGALQTISDVAKSCSMSELIAILHTIVELGCQPQTDVSTPVATWACAWALCGQKGSR
jgi:hypothetical protein